MENRTANQKKMVGCFLHLCYERNEAINRVWYLKSVNLVEGMGCGTGASRQAASLWRIVREPAECRGPLLQLGQVVVKANKMMGCMLVQ